MIIKGNWLNRQILPYSQIKDQLIINNFNDKYIIFINSQSNKKSYFCSFTTNMALNPFGIYCKFAINSESKAVLRLSVKYKPTSVFSLQNLDKITFHIDADVVAVFWSPLRKFIVKECYHPCPVSKQPLHSYLQKAVPLLSGLLYWGRDITTPLHSMKEYTLLSSARQSQNYIHCCIPRSFYLPFRCYAGIYQSSCHIVYKPDWIRTLKWNGLVVRVVVSCIRSTSNHNAKDLMEWGTRVVSCIRSTSNHNL